MTLTRLLTVTYNLHEVSNFALLCLFFDLHNGNNTHGAQHAKKHSPTLAIVILSHKEKCKTRTTQENSPGNFLIRGAKREMEPSLSLFLARSPGQDRKGRLEKGRVWSRLNLGRPAEKTKGYTCPFPSPHSTSD